MARHLSPARLVGTGLFLLALVAFVLWRYPTNEFILLPDPAHPVAPLVTIQGGKDPIGPGGIYFVDVIERKATLLDRIFPSLHEGGTLVPAVELNGGPGISERTRHKQDLHAMAVSQQVAAAVALRELGYKAVVRVDVVVRSVDKGRPAYGELRPGDRILSVDGKPVRSLAELFKRMSVHRPGDVVLFRVRRRGALHVLALKTAADPHQRRRAIVGIRPDEVLDVKLPLKVTIKTRGIGGPSAGLPFALDILEELGRDVDRGYRVAATGAIEPGGTVLPIGGVEQKTIGARRAHADVFLVPAGANAREARRYAHGLRIVAVTSLKQALAALAALPDREPKKSTA